MKVSATLLARSIALFDVADLNPRGTLFFPAVVPVLKDRFSFQVYPQKAEDFDPTNGIVFENGYFNGRAVRDLTFYNDGIKIDVQTSTEDGQAIIFEMLRGLVQDVGITFSEDMIRRWGFLSQIAFHSDIDLEIIHPALIELGQEVSEIVNSRTGLNLRFRTNALSLNFARVNGDIPIAPFGIEKREKTLIEEGKYFSSAPLETESHIRLLQKFETNVRNARFEDDRGGMKLNRIHV